MFKKGDWFFWAARIIFIVFTILAVVFSLIFPFKVADYKGDGRYILLILPCLASCFVFWIMWNLLLSHIYDVKLIRNKLYRDEDIIFRDFMRKEKIGKRNLSEVAQNPVKTTQNRTEKHRKNDYKQLVKICGPDFFLKYYFSVKNNSLGDINVTENYSEEAKTERLSALKQIIDLGLTEDAVKYILKNFGESLRTEDYKEIRKILDN